MRRTISTAGIALAVVLVLGLAGCNGDGDKVGPDGPITVGPPADARADPIEKPEVADAWVRRFGPYLDEETRRHYEEIPPARRFETFGPLFLDLAARDELLREARWFLEATEVDLYYGLPSYAACESFIEARRPGDAAGAGS